MDKTSPEFEEKQIGKAPTSAPALVDFKLTEEEYQELCKGAGMTPDNSPEAKELQVAGNDDNVMDRSRILTFKGSDETTDRDGDIIRVDGWDLGDFEKNPVFLQVHDSRSMPVGRVLKVWKARNVPGSPGGKALMFRVYFPTAKVSKESDAILKLYKAKLLNAVSVGFKIKKAVRPETEEARAAMGLGPYGIEVQAASLLELSAVPIPANQNALVLRSLEMVDCAKALGLGFTYKAEGQEDDEMSEKILAAIAALEKKVDDALVLMAKGLDNAPEKTYVPSEGTAETDAASSSQEGKGATAEGEDGVYALLLAGITGTQEQKQQSESLDIDAFRQGLTGQAQE